MEQDWKLMEFDVKGDERGRLVALEENINIPFTFKRVYFIYATEPGFIRGKHAHKNLQQVAVCVHGSCRFILDNGKRRESFLLDKPHVGLYMNKMVWREMDQFSSDAVVMVVADQLYDEADYIRDYETFLKAVKERKEF